MNDDATDDAPERLAAGNGFGTLPLPARGEIVRDSPELVRVRGVLWSILVRLDAEIAEAQRAKHHRKKDAALSDFLGRLCGARAALDRLHALAYANTLVERFDEFSPLLAQAEQLAKSVGLA